jgi:hypothetical protein
MGEATAVRVFQRWHVMQIRPIRTDKDHHCAALAEIEKLWGASIGTPEGDKLDFS